MEFTFGTPNGDGLAVSGHWEARLALSSSSSLCIASIRTYPYLAALKYLSPSHLLLYLPRLQNRSPVNLTTHVSSHAAYLAACLSHSLTPTAKQPPLDIISKKAVWSVSRRKQPIGERAGWAATLRSPKSLPKASHPCLAAQSTILVSLFTPPQSVSFSPAQPAFLTKQSSRPASRAVDPDDASFSNKPCLTGLSALHAKSHLPHSPHPPQTDTLPKLDLTHANSRKPAISRPFPEAANYLFAHTTTTR